MELTDLSWKLWRCWRCWRLRADLHQEWCNTQSQTYPRLILETVNKASSISIAGIAGIATQPLHNRLVLQNANRWDGRPARILQLRLRAHTSNLHTQTISYKYYMYYTYTYTYTYIIHITYIYIIYLSSEDERKHWLYAAILTFRFQDLGDLRCFKML